MSFSSNPIDRVISGLHEAIASPNRFDLVKTRLISDLLNVRRPDHRNFLEIKLLEIESYRDSKEHLSVIADQIDAWTSREFPISRGYRYRG
jgi:hypothetical protein